MDEVMRKALLLMNANEGNPDVNAALGVAGIREYLAVQWRQSRRSAVTAVRSTPRRYPGQLDSGVDGGPPSATVALPRGRAEASRSGRNRV